MEFNEKEVSFKEIFENYEDRPLTGKCLEIWNLRKFGDLDMSCTSGREYNKPNNFFNYNYIYNHKVSNTITAKDCNVLFDYPRYFNVSELKKSGYYPQDYNFLNIKPHYLIGMSVPPVMTAQIATNIYEQWISNL